MKREIWMFYQVISRVFIINHLYKKIIVHNVITANYQKISEAEEQ